MAGYAGTPGAVSDEGGGGAGNEAAAPAAVGHAVGGADRRAGRTGGTLPFVGRSLPFTAFHCPFAFPDLSLVRSLPFSPPAEQLPDELAPEAAPAPQREVPDFISGKSWKYVAPAPVRKKGHCPWPFLDLPLPFPLTFRCLRRPFPWTGRCLFLGHFTAFP